MKKKKHRLLPYRQALPSILLFQLIAGLFLSLWMTGYSILSSLLIRLTGRVAVSSGDFTFLFTTWQGILILLLTVLTLFLFLGLEVNSLIILCKRLLTGEKPSVLLCIRDGFLSLKKFANPIGLLIVLYISLLSPIIGFQMISLTKNFYIPKFISSVIWSKPPLAIGMAVVLILLFLTGVLFIFLLHGTVLDGMPPSKSGRNSLALLRRNLKQFILEMLRFFLVVFGIAAVLSILIGVVYFFSMLLSVSQPDSAGAFIPLMVGSLTVLFVLLLILVIFSMPFFMLKVTALYLSFQSEGEWEYRKRKNRKSPLVIVSAVLTVLLIAFTTVLVSYFYDDVFPGKVTATYIAHRAGGNEGPENTVAGLEAAYALGASGSEIDIQRTADGYYVVNHDDDFGRTTGVDKKPSEMTLEEVRQLRVDGTAPVPTFEEMLEASRGKLTLYVELKGETADIQMAEDAVKTIRDYEMIDGVVVISLKYDLIDYIETKYPEINTGYLAFASFGDTASLNCDYLALEEEVATQDNIDSIHFKGKKILVWTVNDAEDIEKFLQSGADALITDNVKGTKDITAELESAPAPDRIFNGLFRLFYGSAQR